jgi:aspartate kinase
MSGVTNELIKKSKEISNNFDKAEYDVLVSSGEQVACALIAGRLIHKGLNLDLGCLGKFQLLLKDHIKFKN